jgi:signal transduction histidine kinase
MSSKKILPYLLLFLLPFGYQSVGQVLPLTRSDSGRVIEFQAKYANYLSDNNYKEASRMMNEIGFIYWNYNQYKKAISFYERSLKLNATIENSNGIAMIHNNLGMLYADVEDYDKALYHFTQTLAARRSQKESYSIISSLINRSVVYNNIKKYNLAITDLQEALNLARELNDIKQMASTYAMLSESYEKAGNVDESLKYFELYKSFHDQIQKKEVNKLASELEAESLKKQLAEATAKTKALELEKNEIKLKESGEQLESAMSKNDNLYQNLTRAEMLVELQKQHLKAEQADADAIQAKNIVLEKEQKYIYIITGIVSWFILAITLIVYLNSRKTKAKNQQLHEQNLAIAKQKEQLEVSNDVKNRIFSIIAHDLRGPIGSLQGFFMIIEEFYVDIPEDLKQILSQLRTENAQVSTILDNLLNWAKTQMAELKPKLQEVNINLLVEENIRLLQRSAEAKNIQIIDEVPEGLVAQSDLEMTKIVLRNLIQNAIKFTKQNGKIHIQGHLRDDTTVEITVKDSGVGMSEEKISTLFSLKNNKSTYGTNNEKGTGLGLILCNDLVKICNGQLEVASEINKGTTVTITLNSSK